MGEGARGEAKRRRLRPCGRLRGDVGAGRGPAPPRGDRRWRLSWMRVGALWGSRWGKEATGLWEDLQLTVLRVESTAWPWPSEGSRLGVTGAVCPGKAAGLRTPRWVSGGLAGAGFVLLFRRTAAPTERKVRDPQGVLGVADSWVWGARTWKVRPAVTCLRCRPRRLGGARSAGRLLSLPPAPLVPPTMISSVCVCF